MSRSAKGGKCFGYEYWSARPFNKCGSFSIGRWVKKRTHKAERHQGKVESRQAMNDDLLWLDREELQFPDMYDMSGIEFDMPEAGLEPAQDCS